MRPPRRSPTEWRLAPRAPMDPMPPRRRSSFTTPLYPLLAASESTVSPGRTHQARWGRYLPVLARVSLLPYVRFR